VKGKQLLLACFLESVRIAIGKATMPCLEAAVNRANYFKRLPREGYMFASAVD
jgi:hypothetical protein